VSWDLGKTNLLSSSVILSRKRTRNFLDISNTWKRAVLTNIEGQALADIQLLQTQSSLKRPFVPDVNTDVVGRRTKMRMDDSPQDANTDYRSLHRRYPSPTPGPSTWASAPMGTWGRGSRQ
jgi:hypothetical protein